MGPECARCDVSRSPVAGAAHPVDRIVVAPPQRVTITVPWDAGFSKNAQWRINRQGTMYLTPKAAAARDALAWRLRVALQGVTLQPRRKTWLDIFVRRPDWRQDPINVVDAVADAVQMATHVNDTVYAIARLDWTVDRQHPAIIVTVWQDPDEGANTGGRR